MPAPNDLTPEEEQAFIEHGVQPSGPGMEPTGEPNQPAPEAAPAVEAPAVTTIPVARDPAGRFAPLPNAAQPDPNAPPVQATPPIVDQAAQPQPGAPPPGFVPHQALHEARQQLLQQRQIAQLAQTRMNALLASQQAAQQAAEPMPDLATDPIGYMQAMESRIERFEQERQQEQQSRQIDSAIEQDEASFSLSFPDYNNAAQHYVQSRAQELLHFYPPEQAQTIMMNEARQMAREAWQRGVPAAQMVYQMAQARGYQPGMAPLAPQQPFQPAAQPGFTAPTAVQQVQQVQRGQAATRTLSGGSGSAAPATLNAEAVLAMSDEEFAEYCKLGSKGANAAFAALAGH